MNEKVYIATELTKLLITQENKNGYIYSSKEIMAIYNNFYRNLKEDE